MLRLLLILLILRNVLRLAFHFVLKKDFHVQQLKNSDSRKVSLNEKVSYLFNIVVYESTILKYGDC